MFNDNTTIDDDESFFGTASFFTRFILLLILAGAWIAAAVAIDSATLSAPALSATRTAFLVVSVIAFVEALTIMILSLNEIIFEIVYILLDALFALLLLAVSIAAIVRDAQVNTQVLSGNQYRYGSLAAAAVFGFISVVLYILLIIFYIIGDD